MYKWVPHSFSGQGKTYSITPNWDKKCFLTNGNAMRSLTSVFFMTIHNGILLKISSLPDNHIVKAQGSPQWHIA